MKKIPLILHTDIGSDIDDTWAIAMMLRLPALAPLAILTDTGDTRLRARLSAKFCERANRSEIEICAGIPGKECPAPVGAWADGYDLKRYPGQYHEDGVSRIIEIIRAAEEPLTLVSIGPVTSLAAMLNKAPDIAPKCRFVGMFGSIDIGYNGTPGAVPEYNVFTDIASCRTVFQAPWLHAAITPLDTCGLVRLEEDRYAKLAASSSPLVRDLLDNYRVWSQTLHGEESPAVSSCLYDTVAIHMALSYDYLEMKTLPLSITDDGKTVVDEQNGRPFDVAVRWQDFDAYLDFLTRTLLG